MIRFISESRNRDSWRSIVRVAIAVMFAVHFSTPCDAQPLAATERAEIDRDALAVLAATGAPSASIAIVRGGEVVYERAYGDGRIDPKTPATPSMRYAIGSVSKQFTATALLLLEEEGKLSLNDKVGKWFPQLTRANVISVRQLLSMTSGYQDYWPQDYVFTDMQRPATAQMIMQRWAAKPLDFDPGTKWQYSNTNYVIAAAIVERVAGMAFMEFLRQRIFTPLKMTSVADFDAAPLGEGDAEPYPEKCPRAAPARAEGGDRMAVRSGTTCNDGARPGSVGHRCHQPSGPAIGVVQDTADGHPPRRRTCHRVRARREH